jgi:hypothetical protein
VRQVAILFASVVMIAALSAASIPGGWIVYVNPRFAFSICYPPDLHHKGPDSINGDGRMFVDRAGTELRVWGEYDPWEGGLREAIEQNRKFLANDGARVTYQAKGENWFVLSGQKAGRIIYLRSRVTRGRYTSFELTYPKSASAKWSGLIPQLAACLHDTSPTQYDR